MHLLRTAGKASCGKMKWSWNITIPVHSIWRHHRANRSTSAGKLIMWNGKPCLGLLRNDCRMEESSGSRPFNDEPLSANPVQNCLIKLGLTTLVPPYPPAGALFSSRLLTSRSGTVSSQEGALFVQDADREAPELPQICKSGCTGDQGHCRHPAGMLRY